MPEAPPDQAPLAPTTTAEENRKTAGQRHVNLVWEATQAIIAITITCAMVSAVWVGKDATPLENAFTLIIAIYFVRMNHTKIGGVQTGDEGR